ncbi:MAG: ABC transporter permease [Thiobacillus sp.]
MMLALLRKELLALSRDPHALAALFIMPAIFIVVMSLALKNVYAPPMDRFDYGIDVREPSIASTRFVEQWEKTHGPARQLHADWQASLQRGQLAYVLVLKKDLMNALVSPQAPQSPVVRLVTEPGLAQSARRSLQAETAGAVGEMRAAALAIMRGESATPPVAIDAFIASEVSGDKMVVPNAVQQNVPAWLAFGMFFVVTALSSLFIQEQRDGTLARLVSIGAPAYKLILAKALPYLLINAIQAALMLAVGVELMPLLGGDALSLAGIHWPALLLVLASLSIAAIGFALLVACVVRTHAQANTLGPMLNILMAALGGVMVPTMVMPAAMQQLAAWSPMNWGLEGLLSVLVRNGAMADAWPWAARLLIFGGVSLLLASVFFQRRIRA